MGKFDFVRCMERWSNRFLDGRQHSRMFRLRNRCVEDTGKMLQVKVTFCQSTFDPVYSWFRSLKFERARQRSTTGPPSSFSLVDPDSKYWSFWCKNYSSGNPSRQNSKVSTNDQPCHAYWYTVLCFVWPISWRSLPNEFIESLNPDNRSGWSFVNSSRGQHVIRLSNLHRIESHARAC